jgi:phage recombination protein Bet
MNSEIIAYDQNQIQLIKDTCCRGATDNELQLFMYTAKRTGLDPLTKQIYSVGRWDSRLGREVRTTQTSIDGFRVVAERSGKYAGQVGPYWCDSDGVWKDVWLSANPPSAAKVGVMKEGFKEPLFAVANWTAYAQTGKDGNPTQFWKKMPALMLAKVAEALALRKAFPQDLSSIYTSDEMSQADPQDQKPTIEPTQPVKAIDYKKKAELVEQIYIIVLLRS